MLQAVMDAHLGYDKHSADGYNSGNSRNGSFTKKIQSEHGEHVIESVSNIEDELRDIYKIDLSTSAISIITNKVIQAASEWQNPLLERFYMVVWMDCV